MDPSLRKELQIRARVEAIYNRTEDDFDATSDYNDYLEIKEDLIFNLVEGIDVEDQEHKIDEYKRTHADEIARNEAKKAERLREQASATYPTAQLRAEAAEHIGVSGTAAAFHGGKDPEPHQGMEYTAAIPTGAVGGGGMQAAPVAGGGGMLNTEGDVIQQGGGGRGSKEEWLKMATSSGWSQEFSSNRAVELAFGSLLCF